MAHTAYDHYLENEVLHADPLKLVSILYQAALESVAAARIHVRSGAIRERSRSINRASEIINHLMLSLDHSAGTELSRNLAELYAYVLDRLVEANAAQSEPPLAETEQLLSTLLRAWQEVQDFLAVPAALPRECAEPAFASMDESPGATSYLDAASY